MHISGRDARKHNGSADVAWTRLGIRQGNRCTFIFDFTEQSKCWPRVHDDKDADMVLELARSISAARRLKEGACWAQMVEYGSPSGDERELDESRIKRFLHLFQTELTGFFAFLGGTVLLKTTGKFTPVDQWIDHDEHALGSDKSRFNMGPLFGSRYDQQISVMGKAFKQHMVFLIGCGSWAQIPQRSLLNAVEVG